MKIIFYTLTFICIHQLAFAQSKDFINVTNKRGHIINSFFDGSAFVFQTTRGNYVDGRIKIIRNDSVFVNTYQMGYFVTNFGFSVIDTVATFLTGYHYKEIASIKIYKKTRFIRGKLPGMLMAGGAGYALLNIINGLGYGESITSNTNKKRLGIAAGTFGLGYLIQKLFPIKRFSSKKDKINYVNMQVAK
jgi:hypothetical protein